MSFFTPSNRSLTRETNRVVNPRRLLAPCLALSLPLSLLIFGGGVWVGQGLGIARAAISVEESTPASEGHFVIARVGEMVGRMKSLESDVLALQRMLSEQRVLERELSALDPALLPVLAPAPLAGAQGGLLLPPRGCAQGQTPAVEREPLLDLQQSETSARCLRSVVDALMRGVAERNAALMTIPSRRPVGPARLGSAYGNRIDPFRQQLAFHSGVDFALSAGSDVFAAAGGRVRFAGNRGAYGKLVEIDHGNRLVTRYAHLSRLHVRAGDIVTPQQRVGAVGSTGRSTGPHLHFEVLHQGRFVDPQRFLALGELQRVDDDLAAD
ncbi:M23 family metallopeptidase [Stutzerimonas degradans]|uniref:M23 family metallopeptidase n=1 Tax=Stutzerimonas degradans TaxID=2968968 RepID=UPI0013F4C2D2|nr:M23 family metallopeptidase [Stutzerimonas degradans]MCF6753663.1 M23 family metallopeptidase [Stutzerimonas stutzeri]NHC09459.1 M23 family metallopeptidase [Stutzerimonas degradans]NHW02301.1 M23 family metallopeptidase [Stutzerimonas degradans]